MKNLYVRELFVLLRELGTTQQVVADYLNVARATVASWAGGQRAVPKRHAGPFLTFAAMVIEHACTAAWAQNHVPERPSLLGSPSSAEAFVQHVNTQLERWAIERFNTTGALDTDYELHKDQARMYLHLPPSTLSADARRDLAAALRGMLRDLRALAHFDNDLPETEGRFLLGSPPSQVSPVERFWQIAKRPGPQTREEEDEHQTEEEEA
jgi:hypothetical protein